MSLLDAPKKSLEERLQERQELTKRYANGEKVSFPVTLHIPGCIPRAWNDPMELHLEWKNSVHRAYFENCGIIKAR